MKKYKVEYFESERGWGSDRWETFYDTFEEARDAFKWTNAQNTSSTAPDYYIIATGIYEFINGKFQEIEIQ